MISTSENVARAICAEDLRLALVPSEQLPGLVNQLWPVVALEIQRGVPDPTWGIGETEIALRMREYRRIVGKR